MKKLKPITPFLIVSLILGVLLLFLFINYTFNDNNGGNALGGTIAFLGLIILLIIMLVERIIVSFKMINIYLVYIIEALILLGVSIYIYNNGFSIG